ncbi:MAG TPA: MarR family transcriptional regulator [Streptosporangiaceae bacterium]|jgi:DNA-binding MarR family transcriptional regulator
MDLNPAYRELQGLIHRVTVLGDRVGERLFTERIGIGRAQFLVLRTIAEAGETGARSQQDIAERLSLTKGTVSRHVASAMVRGWLTVEPSPVSRREHAVVLTAAGRALLDQGMALQGEREGLANLALDPGDVAATIRILSAMCRLLEQEDK